MRNMFINHNIKEVNNNINKEDYKVPIIYRYGVEDTTNDSINKEK